MNAGDYVKYRSRRNSDPPRTGGASDGWDEEGIILRTYSATFNTSTGLEPAALFWTTAGDFVEVRCSDLEILKQPLERKEGGKND